MNWLIQRMLAATFRDAEIEIILELLACTDPYEHKLLELELIIVRSFTHTGADHAQA